MGAISRRATADTRPSPFDRMVPFCLLVALSMPLLAVGQAGWMNGTEVLWPLSLLAAGLAWALAYTRIPAWAGLSFGLVGTALAAISATGNLLTLIPEFVGSTLRSIGWLWPRLADQAVDPFPLTPVLDRMGERTASLLFRVSLWWTDLQAGQPNADNVIFLLLLTFVAWAVAFWAGWWVYRHGEPAIAMLPAGGALLYVVSLTEQGPMLLLVYAAATLLLLVWMHTTGLLTIWERLGYAYSTEVLPDVLGIGTALLIVISLVAVVGPAMTTSPVAQTFWRVFYGPLSALESGVNRAFAGVSRVSSVTSGEGLVLGEGVTLSEGQADLSQRVVMVVRLSDPPPPRPDPTLGDAPIPKLYLRAEALDSYDGIRWQNSQKEEEDRGAGEPTGGRLVGRLVRQYYETMRSEEVVFALHAPLAVDQPYRVARDDFGTLRLRLSAPASSYSVSSVVPQPSLSELRRAPASTEEMDRYQALPPISERVRSLAREVANEKAASAYDQAAALEAYLRRLNYRSRVESPPEGREGVDYFLFESQEGYCNYFASALVVMLRSLAIPARIASGYATGEFDYDKSLYVVRERDAHAWPEVYFAGVGWVPFEPTPINPLLQRAPEPEGSGPEPLAEIKLPEVRREGLPWRWLALVPLGAALWALGQGYRERRLSDAEYVKLIFGRLCRYAGYLGAGRKSWQTPEEYGQMLAARLENPLGQAPVVLGRLYTQAVYSRRPIGPADRQWAAAAWSALRLQLWRLRQGEKG